MNPVVDTVYASLHLYEKEVRTLCSPCAGNNDSLLVETLEWGWEHAAPPGERYRPRKTEHLTEPLDLSQAASDSFKDVTAHIAATVETLLTKARERLNGALADQATLSATLTATYPHPRNDTFLLIIELVFPPADPEPSTFAEAMAKQGDLRISCNARPTS